MEDNENRLNIGEVEYETIKSQIFWTEILAYIASLNLKLDLSVCQVQDVFELIELGSEENNRDLDLAGKIAHLTYLVEDRNTNRKMFLLPMKWIVVFEGYALIHYKKLGMMLEGGPADLASHLVRFHLKTDFYDKKPTNSSNYAPVLNLSNLLRNLWMNYSKVEDRGPSDVLEGVPLLPHGAYSELTIRADWLKLLGIKDDLHFDLNGGLRFADLSYLPTEKQVLLNSLFGVSEGPYRFVSKPIVWDDDW